MLEPLALGQAAFPQRLTPSLWSSWPYEWPALAVSHGCTQEHPYAEFGPPYTAHN